LVARVPSPPEQIPSIASDARECRPVETGTGRMGTEGMTNDGHVQESLLT
jgi:hypothetical protein